MGNNKRRRDTEVAVPGAGRTQAAEPRESWIRAKGPALRFVLISTAFMLFFYGVFYTPPEESAALDGVIRGYLRAYAAAAGVVLDLIGFDAEIAGTTIFLGGKAVDVVRGCDAMEPIALYVAAVIAMRAEWRSKLVGLLVGLPVLAFINLLRIVALSIVSVKFADQFETAHLTVGQTVFVVCTLCLWFAWVLWARRREARAVRAD